jgi:hypothetical protein
VEHFARVVDINSDSPFPPIVSESARVEEVLIQDNPL